MGLFDRLKKQGSEPLRGVLLKGGGRVEVVGESNYQDTFEKVCGKREARGVCQEVTAFLIPEPTNQWDPGAVRVAVEVGESFETLGYLARPAAQAFAPVAQKLAAKNLIGAVTGEIRGGWDSGKGDRGNFGISLDLAQPDQCLPEELR